MRGHADRYPHRDAPDKPTQAAASKQDQPESQLVQRPSDLHEAIPGIVRELRFHRELRRRFKSESAMQLPKGIDPYAACVRKEIMARRLSLRPIADVVNLEDSDRPRHAHEYPDPHEKTFERFAAFERPVDQAPVHAQGMAEQKRDVAQTKKDRESAPRKVEHGQRHRRAIHASVPDRLERRPHHATPGPRLHLLHRFARHSSAPRSPAAKF